MTQGQIVIGESSRDLSDIARCDQALIETQKKIKALQSQSEDVEVRRDMSQSGNTTSHQEGVVGENEAKGN